MAEPQHIATILGTRPEIIRLSEIIRVLDGHCRHSVIMTGQNFEDELSGLFFREMGVRRPDLHLEIKETSFAAQAARILERVDDWLAEHRPDRVVLLGDTNSALSAIVAARRHIPVYHLEAGNRCYDDRVPEEINRRLIDHCSTMLLPYTHRSKDNLVREGISRDRIHVTGNPIFEVLNRHEKAIAASEVLARLGLKPREYFMVTAHRAENVDQPVRLNGIMEGLARIAARFTLPVVVSVHPRMRRKLDEFGIKVDTSRIRLSDPFGFFDFVALERAARLVLTDSGTVQEECCIFGVPNLTLRDTTERPETLEVGSNILAGTTPDEIERAAALVMRSEARWAPPSEYVVPHVAEIVARIVLGLPGFARQAGCAS